jgi:hypothetical protein
MPLFTQVMMLIVSRTDLENKTGERLSGIDGLWIAVLLEVLRDLARPGADRDRQRAREWIDDPENVFFLGLCHEMDVEPGELRRRIILRYMEK